MTQAFDVTGELPTGVTVLEASAGTGKTYTIAALAARFVAEGIPLEKLLLVTFTRMATGELRGTISHTECGPFLRARDAVPDDRVLSKPVGRYDCVAVQQDAIRSGKTVGKVGYAWVAALNFKNFTYVTCRNSPAQGEAGKPLAFVRLDRACLATNSRAIGSGYVDPDSVPTTAPTP